MQDAQLVTEQGSQLRLGEAKNVAGHSTLQALIDGVERAVA